MKRDTRNRLIGSLLAGTLLAFAAVSAQADTTAGTSVSNTASVSYQVGGIQQTDVTSKESKFKVDRELSLTVTKVDSAIVEVSPGQTKTVLVYKVTNKGNDTQGVSFTTANEADATTNPFTGQPKDNFDVTGQTVYVSKANSATYNATDDTASSIAQLTVGSSQYVFVISDIPLAQVDGDSATVGLIAQVAQPGAAATYGSTPGTDITSDDATATWTPGTVQNIFLDAAGSDDSQNDGKASAQDAVLVKSASLKVTKTATVVSDPTGVKPAHAIPGAVVEYTITVANGGSSNATSVGVSDSLDTQIAAGNIAYNTGTLSASIDGTAVSPCTEAADTDGCTWDGTAHTVTVTGLTVPAGKSAVVTFKVAIQ